MCGKKQVTANAANTGSKKAVPGEYPWMVAVYNISLGQQEQICGGSIISRFFVLSAAHCVTADDGTPNPKEYYMVVAGKNKRDLNMHEDNAQFRKVKRLIVHKNYKAISGKYDYDIVLVEIDIPFKITLNVQPVCLDWENIFENDDLVEGKEGVVAGWGFTKPNSDPSPVLRKLWVPYRSKENCQKYMDEDFVKKYYNDNKICAGFTNKGKSICNGDSGGGLNFNSTGTFYVRGIASLTQPGKGGGCDSDHYALYTRVSKYREWIVDITLKRV